MVHGLPVVVGLVTVGDTGPDRGAEAGRQQQLPGRVPGRSPAVLASLNLVLNITGIYCVSKK